jgi:hypothetical protein
VGLADRGGHEQGVDLPHLDQLGISTGLVHLHGEQEPARAQDIGGIDDARRFFVLRDELRSRLEECGIVPRDLDEVLGMNTLHADLGDVGVVPGVLLEHDSPQPVDRDVSGMPTMR